MVSRTANGLGMMVRRVTLVVVSDKALITLGPSTLTSTPSTAKMRSPTTWRHQAAYNGNKTYRNHNTEKKKRLVGEFLGAH